MATDPLERAVIEAARQLVTSGHYDGTATSWPDASAVKLAEAVRVLDAHLAGQDGTEIEWHELAESDQLRSAKTGVFWEVIAVQKIKDGYQIGIRKDGKRALITRPTEAEPTAWVKRGPTGQAVDALVTVFSSGGRA